jgi:aldose 1-epimerase
MSTMTSKLVKLQSDVLDAWICPEHGAAIVHLFERRTGFPLLRETPTDAIAAGETPRFACYPLIPYSNRIAYRRMQFGDRTIELASNRPGTPHSLHGNAWMSPWTVKQLRHDSLVLSFSHDVGDAHWPFPYRVTQIFTVYGGTLSLAISLTNSGTEAFPAGAGWHPFFHTDIDTRVKFSARQVWLNDADMLPCWSIPASGAWDFTKGRAIRGLAIDNCFAGWERRAEIIHQARARRIIVSGTNELSHLVVFHPADGREFIALEPVSHVNDGVNLAARGHADTGIAILRPRQTLNVGMAIRLEEI